MEYTQEQLDYIKKVEDLALERARMFGADFNEVDFFCGAMIYFINGNNLEAPTRWVLAPLTGRKIVDLIKEERTKA